VLQIMLAAGTLACAPTYAADVADLAAYYETLK
jgi:hypothetical protein